jgi:soluble lytic murein transglycosylase-like protein
MTQARPLIRILLLVAASTLVGTEARGELLFLSNGGTLSVKSYRIEGDHITVALRRGGEATFDRALVARIAADEVPEPDPAADAEAAVTSPSPALAGQPPAGVADVSRRPFADMIQAVSQRHGVDPVLVHAMIQAESNYEPRARSTKGARGLMQVLPSTARQFARGNLFDPRHNLETGVQYLKGLLAQFELPQAIAAYNAGPAAVRKYGGVPPYAETRAYVERVLAGLR